MTTDPHPGIAVPSRVDGTDAEPPPTHESGETSTGGAVETPRKPAKAGARRAESPSWWHKEHPVFTPLSGFFAGLLVVIALPTAFGAVLTLLLPDETAEKLYPLALLVFLIPLGLIVAKPTRRFGRYMLFGMVLTAVVVLAVAALTAYVLIKTDG